MQANFQVYNVLNANSILSRNNTHSAQTGDAPWVLNGRLIAVAAVLRGHLRETWDRLRVRRADT